MADTSTKLCSSCSSISLPSLIEAIPIPAYPKGGGCGVPNFFEFSIPEPLSFGNLDEPNTLCSLCKLISARESAQSAGSTAKQRPLLLAGLCPPSQHSHKLTWTRETKAVDFFGEAQPQWKGYIEGQKRVNTLEPITKREGTRGKEPSGYVVRSPWQVNLVADEGTAAATHITRRPLSAQGSDDSFRRLLKTMEECNDGHANCKLGVNGLPLPETPELPTRVIDVGSDSQTPRLILSRGQRAQYITLSHCWGAQRWVATTSKTLPQMLDGFDLSIIPKTYADAILVTRKLGCSYLWIDSFCILQDDRQDWEAEAAKMGDIYEKAFCNIAATGAEDGNAGFLHSRRQEPSFVRVGNVGDKQQFYFTDQVNSDFDRQVRQRRINSRGWVMQERVLSRRTIHFAMDQWYWECGHHVVSEDGWQHDTRSSTRSITPSLRESLQDATMAIGKVFRMDDKFEIPEGEKGVRTSPAEILWAQILRAYSACSLTFWSDKMPALQGLATRFHDVTSSKYHFGHWVQNNEPLPLNLMWYALKDGGLAFAEKPSMPSWSCLKGDGSIGFHDCRGATPTTRIDRIGSPDAWLLLRGRLRAAKLSMPNGENAGARATYFAMSFVNKTQYGSFTNTLGPARFDDADRLPKDFTLLLVFEKLPFQMYSNVQKDQLALVLQEIGEDELQERVFEDRLQATPKYRRIGIANVNNHSFFKDVPFSELLLL